MLSIKNKFNPYLFIFIIIIIGYWQVSFFSYGLKWDLIDVVFPFRYYFSECIQSGYFPFWNPYIQTGTPFYADLQAPTYYPELILTSLFGGYTIYKMHILLIVYLFIAAIGMYQLSYHFNKNKMASIIAGLSYSFSGFFVGHGQHFFLIVGAAWMPFVLVSYLKLNQNLKIIDALKSGIFVFLMLTGSYQALSIVMIYLLLLIFIYFIIHLWINKKRKEIFQLVKVNLVFALLIIILSLPLLASTLEIINSVERLDNGVNLKEMLNYQQPFTSLISFILPFSTLKNSALFGNIDFSLINHYFGVIPLLFFIGSLFRKKSILEYIILAFGLIILSMSFDFLPVRQFLYNNVPFMNLFLSASYIRIFGILALILLSVNYYADFESNIVKNKRRIIIIAFSLLTTFLFFIILSVTKISHEDFNCFVHFDGFESLLNNITFYQSIFLQSVFHFFVILAFIAIVFFYNKIKHSKYFILFLFIGEIFFASQLNMSTTVVDMQFKSKNMQADLLLCPKNFPNPINNKIIFNDNQNAFFLPFWRNTSIFNKQISFDAFSSFKLNTYEKLESNQKLKESTINNHLFYFSDSIFPLEMDTVNSENIKFNSRYLYLSKVDFIELSKIKVKTSASDKIKMLEFTPNKVIIETSSLNQQFLTMLQTNYNGWKAYIDNNPTQIFTSNYNYRTILLPKGKHLIKYEYKNNKILILYYISNILFALLVIILIGYELYLKKYKYKYYLFVPIILFGLIVILIIANVSKKENYSDVFQYYKTKYNQAIFTYEEDFEDITSSYDSLIVFSGKKSFDIKPETEYLPIIELVQENKKIKKGTLLITAKINANQYTNALIVSEINGNWHASKIEKQIESLNQWNELIYIRRIPEMKDGEILKVYIWNSGKSKFYIDNIKVEMFDY